MAIRQMPDKPSETDEVVDIILETERDRRKAEVLRDSAISAAVNDLAHSFFHETVIPGFQALLMSIVEWVTGNIEDYSSRAIYGEEGPSDDYYRDRRGRSYIAYDKRSKKRLPSTQKERREEALRKREAERRGDERRAHIRTQKLKSPVDPHYIVFPHRDDALKVHRALMRIASEYGYARMEDLYQNDLVGIEPSYTDTQIGWSFQDIRRAPIAQSRGGYVIDLPQARDLDDMPF